MKHKDNLYLITGVVLLAFAISFFLTPAGLVTGGATGLGIIINDLAAQVGYNVPMWLLNLIINLPLFLVGFKVFGFKFLAKTLFGTVLLSVVLYVMDMMPHMETDLVLSSIIGGAVSGAGIGLVFRAMATTGGSDLAAIIVKKYLKNMSLSYIIFVIDAVIILLGLFVFGFINTMYAIISVYVSSKVIHTVLEGLSFAKAASIISNHSSKIAQELIDVLDRGVTSLYGKGMYTGDDKNVLLCVVSVKEIIRLKEVVSKIDESAFVIVADVKEVLGEGFQPMTQ